MTDEAGLADASVGEAVEGGGAFGLLRRRLDGQARDLLERAAALNDDRVAAFGSGGLELVASERIRTEVAAAARDVASVGGLLVLGYNVRLDLAETAPEDVFQLFRPDRVGSSPELHAVAESDADNFLADPAFRADFAKLYRYYGKAELAALRSSGDRFLAVFRIGAAIDDVVVLRWAVGPGGSVTYLDDRGAGDYRWPDRHDFTWRPTGREDQIAGADPRVSVAGEVFVQLLADRIEMRVDDGTPQGRVEIDEPVAAVGQSLADVSLASAELGPVLVVRLGLYNEDERYYVFDRRTRSGQRIDAVGQATRRLPEDHGIVFPGGYHLATGQTRVFEADVTGLQFQEQISAPNGEDVLYVFHHRVSGEYSLLPYNLVRKEASPPIPCHGFSLFDDGSMVLFRGATGDDEPTRVHPVQWWTTPFASDEHALRDTDVGGFCGRIGNAELVRGVSDAMSLGRLVLDAEPAMRTYEAIIDSARRLNDTYLWLDDAEARGLHDVALAIGESTTAIIDEYDKVQRLRADAAGQLDEAERQVSGLSVRIGRSPVESAEQLTDQLSELRVAQGRVLVLRDVREIDVDRVGELAADVAGQIDRLAERAVDFLDGDAAFAPFHARVDEVVAEAETVATVAELTPRLDALDELSADLQLLAETVSALDVDDPTVRTAIVRRVGDVVAVINRGRTRIDARRRELTEAESSQAFAAEAALVQQSLGSALAVVDTPEDCDDQLARLLVTVERLESRFADNDERITELAELRDRVYEAFTARRQELLDLRSQRVRRVLDAAERMLATVERRASDLTDAASLASFFAGDPMVARVRDLTVELRSLGEGGRADELDATIRAAADTAQREIRDRADLFDDDGSTVRFGPHRFTVNTQPFEVSLASDADHRLAVVVGGTDYRRSVDDALAGHEDFAGQHYVSETAEVARAEFLAHAVLSEALEADRVKQLLELRIEPGGLERRCREVAEARYDEGYERGVHDHDAALLLDALVGQLDEAPILRFGGPARSLALLWWSSLDTAAHDRWSTRVQAAGRLAERFGQADAVVALAAELAPALRDFADAGGLDVALVDEAADYLVAELGADEHFAEADTAATLVRRLRDALDGTTQVLFDNALAAAPDVAGRFGVARQWLAGVVTSDPALAPYRFDVDEAATHVAVPDLVRRTEHDGGAVEVSGLVSSHPRIVDGSLTVRLDELSSRLVRHHREVAPPFRAFQEARRTVLADARDELNLDEHVPGVMSAFVRNRLIDAAYLPLIGANLARQLGEAGDAGAADRQGLLVVVSPPGYGKTTLMGWVADRLGLLMVKVNGPALGTGVTSLDPAEAPDATSRAEVVKINLALQLGSNVMLYVDDIQHTNPELLQKFIPLADATRRIEGVVDGRPHTFDLRGRRFCVVMAGNPYTESGGRFRLPDMLTNRADVHNLGDVLSDHRADFELSYIENALTSNPTLTPLAGRDPADLPALVDMADGIRPVGADALTHGYDAAELDEVVGVLAHLRTVQRTVLTVNEAYIASAAQADADRVEPPFLLQGSYRNMNRLAAQIVAAMTRDEVATVIADHYRGEAQTLTSAAEANLLKLGALQGTLDADGTARWEAICRRYVDRAAVGDPAAAMARSLGDIADAYRRITPPRPSE